VNAVIIDTETTGLVEPAIVEVAYVRLASLAPLDVHPLDAFIQRFNPGKRIDLGAMATHHITDEDVADEPPAASFALPDDVDTIIGHNVDFDWRAIGSPSVRRICTLALARRCWPKLDSHSLTALLYHVDRPAARHHAPHAHSAIADVHMLGLVLPHLLELVGTPLTIDGLWGISEAARVPAFMPYGKHKGVPMAEVPRDYKRWLLNQPDVDEYLRKALAA